MGRIFVPQISAQHQLAGLWRTFGPTFWISPGKKKAHKHNFFCPVGLGTTPGLSRGFRRVVPGTNPVKTWDNPGFSPYSTHWKPDFTGFVPAGKNPVCPWDDPGDEGRHRKFMWKKFMCLFRSLLKPTFDLLLSDFHVVRLRVSGEAKQIADLRSGLAIPSGSCRAQSKAGTSLIFFSLLFWKKARKTTKKTRLFSLLRTPQIPGKEGKNNQKNKEFLAKQKARKSKKARKRRLGLAHRNRSDFCDLRLRCPSQTPEIAAILETRQSNAALRFMCAMENR